MKPQITLLALVLTLFSCAGTRLETPDPSVVTTGKARLLVEFARSEQEKATGLMFRETLETNRGMVFVFDPPSTPAFYMKNTRVPLDILFVDTNRIVVDIQQMEPFDETDLHRPPGPVGYAIEAVKGWARAHGVKSGDRIDFEK